MIKIKVKPRKRKNPPYFAPKITATERNRVKKVIQDWQWHHKDFFDTKYWKKRFTPFEDMFDKYKATNPYEYYRSERTDIDNKYEDRYSSWSHSYDDIKGFGWGERRMVATILYPDDIEADLLRLGLDSEGSGELIVKPGKYITYDADWRYNTSWPRYDVNAFEAYQKRMEKRSR